MKQEPYDWRKHSDPERKSNVKDSKTVPDMNYSVREILNKFTTGQPINGMGTYNEFDGEYLNHHSEEPDFDGFMPNPNTLDLVDRQLLAQRSKNELKLIEERKANHLKESEEFHKTQENKVKELTEKLAQLEKLEQKNNILENPAGGTDRPK